MTERYDEIERQMGILAYVSPENKGFAAVVKARYSDFIVHEVGPNHKIARLESLENNLYIAPEKKEEQEQKPAIVAGVKRCNDTTNEDSTTTPDDTNGEDLAPKAKKPKTDDGDATAKEDDTKMTTTNDDTTPEVPTITSTELLEQAKSKLIPLVGETAADGAITLLQKWEHLKTNQPPNTRMRLSKKGVDDETKYYTLPLIDDKEKRKGIHMLIRSELQTFAIADTVDKKIRIWHRLFANQSPNFNKFGKGGDGGAARGGDRKSNGDGGDKRGGERGGGGGWPADRPPYLQFVLYKENIDTGTAAKDIARIARLPPKNHRHNRGGGAGVGAGMGYAGMKDKRGITTQFCTVYKKTPGDLLAINRRGGTGGGNTRAGGFGLMRVGGFEYVDRYLSLGMLSGNRFRIVLRNVCVTDDDDTAAKKEQTTNTANNETQRIVNTKQKLQIAANKLQEYGFINYFGMQRFGKYLDTHKVGIAVLKGNFEMACDIIMSVKPGENDRQSEAREKWAARFTDVDTSNDDAARDAEAKCAREVQRSLGRFMNCEISIVGGLARKPRDYRRAFSSIAKHMRSMFLHGYQSYLWNRAASHRIEEGGRVNAIVGDLVLTMDRTEAEGGSGSSGLKGKEVKVVTQEDVDGGKYTITDVVLPMVGTKIEYPTNSTGKLFDTMLAEDELCKEDFAKIGDRELALGGDYRKIICKPHDVAFEIKKYKDPVQPLIQTDLMKLKNIPLECIDLSVDGDGNGEEKQDDNNSKTKAILGMVVDFTLPPSAYATIALRELMKRPTSSDYQRELQLEGDCEGNLLKTTKMEYNPTEKKTDLENKIDT